MTNNITRAHPNPWRVVLIGALFFFFQFMQMNLFNSLSDVVMTHFNIDGKTLGSLSSLFLLAIILFVLPAGFLADSRSVRNLMLCNLAISIAGTALMGLTDSLFLFGFGRLLTGFAHAFCFCCCIKLANEYFPIKRMAMVCGLVVTIGMLGGVVAQTPLTLLLKRFDWQEVFLLDAGLGVLIWVLIYFNVFDAPTATTKHVPTLSTIASHLNQVITNKQNWLAGAYTGFLNLPIIVLGALWGNLFLVTNHSLSSEQASIVCSMLFFGTIIGSPLIGYISDKSQKRLYLMYLGVFGSLGLFLVLLFSSQLSYPALLSIFLGIGIISSTQVISYPLIAASNHSDVSASALSVASVLIMSIGMVFQPLVGALLDFFSNKYGHSQYSPIDFKLALTSIAFSFILALFCCLLLDEVKPEEVS